MKTKNNPEMPMVPKAHLKNVEHQRDQYKAERDSLIDDLPVLKANISRLERENGHKDDVIRWNSKRIEDLKFENKKFKRIAKNLAGDSYKYTTLTNHIRLKAENNPGVSRYIDLVNYIDRLERD